MCAHRESHTSNERRAHQEEVERDCDPERGSQRVAREKGKVERARECEAEDVDGEKHEVALPLVVVPDDGRLKRHAYGGRDAYEQPEGRADAGVVGGGGGGGLGACRLVM